MAPADSSARFSLRPSATVLGLLVLGAVLFGAYANSFRVPFLFDDTPTIVENITLRSFRTAWFPPGNSGLTVSGRPVLNLSLALNHALGGERVAGYHAVNLLIHFLSALAFFGLVRRSLELPRSPDSTRAAAPAIALAIAFVWALHPLQTESVTYVVQRAESLAGLFYLVTLYAFVRAVAPDVSAGARTRWQAGAVVACLLGMGTKETMVSAPLIVLLFDRTFVSGSFREAWRARRALHLSLAATWLFLGWCIWSTGARGGTVGFSAQMPWWRYALTQAYAIPHYLRLALWPAPLVFDYGDMFTPQQTEVVIGLMVVLALLAGTLWALRKKPVVGFLGCAFFALLAPTSSVIPVITQTMAEHRMYLALAPVTVALVTGSWRWLGLRVLFGWLVLALALGAVTHRRNHDYRSLESLAADTVTKQPRNARAWCTLAMCFCTDGKLAAAKSAVEEAMRIDPESSEVLMNYANVLGKAGDKAGALAAYEKALRVSSQLYDAHFGMGVILSELGRTDEAVAHLQAAIALRPSAGFAHYNLGNALVAAGQTAEALPHFARALEEEPAAAEVRNNFGNALLGLGRAGEALPILEAGLRLAPDSVDLHLTRGLVLLALGRVAEATAEFESVLRRHPDSAKAHADLGLALMTAGKKAEACEHYESALRLGKDVNPPGVTIALHVSLADARLESGDVAGALENYRAAVALAPANEQLRHQFARLLLQTGDISGAVLSFEQLIRQNPAFVEAHNDLGLAYAQLGRIDAARQQFEEALRLRPDDPAARANLAALAGRSKP